MALRLSSGRFEGKQLNAQLLETHRMSYKVSIPQCGLEVRWRSNVGIAAAPVWELTLRIASSEPRRLPFYG